MYIHICRHGEDTYIHDYAHMLNIYTILYIHYVYTMIYIIYIYIYIYFDVYLNMYKYIYTVTVVN